MTAPTPRDRLARRRAIVFALLVALCLALLAVSQAPAVQDVRRGVNFALAPIRDTLASGTHAFTDVVSAVGEIDLLRRENLELSDRVDQLEDQISQLQAVREDNERLARLLKTRASLTRETVAAEVIARQSTPFERAVTLDRGEEAGIEVGDALLTEGGALAGTVVEVGRGQATARLLNDTRSLVIGIDASTRATGEVTGRLSAPLAMEDIPATDEVSVGDLIVTAGLSLGKDFRSFYPKGLLIGEVMDVVVDAGAIVQTALVEPAADLDHLETVLVITDYRVPAAASADPGEAADGSGDATVEEAPDQGSALEPGATDEGAATPEPTRRARPGREPTPEPSAAG